jgi:hypothetical protein
MTIFELLVWTTFGAIIGGMAAFFLRHRCCVSLGR